MENLKDHKEFLFSVTIDGVEQIIQQFGETRDDAKEKLLKKYDSLIFLYED